MQAPSFLVRKDTASDVRNAPKLPPLPSDVGLPPHLEAQRLQSITRLGTRWLLHPIHSPKKGDYNGWPKSRTDMDSMKLS